MMYSFTEDRFLSECELQFYHLMKKLPAESVSELVTHVVNLNDMSVHQLKEITQPLDVIAIVKNLPSGVMTQLCDIAERIHVLSDILGMSAFRSALSKLNHNEREEVSRCSCQAERLLWLYLNQPDTFQETFIARIAGCGALSFSEEAFQIRQNPRLQISEAKLHAFRNVLQEEMLFHKEKLSVEIVRCGGTASCLKEDTIMVVIHYSDFYDQVGSSQAGTMLPTHSESIDVGSICYTAKLGLVEVYAFDSPMRKVLFRAFCQLFEFPSEVQAESRPVQFKFHHLLNQRQFDLLDGKIQWAGITELVLLNNGRHIRFSTYQGDFELLPKLMEKKLQCRFEDLLADIVKVEISVVFPEENFWPGRSLKLIFETDREIYIEGYRSEDRQTCRQLLRQWEVIELGEMSDA